MAKPILFIDRDGVIIEEPKDDFQIDSFEKTKFVKGVIGGLSNIAKLSEFYMVLVTNQDGLGTPNFPIEKFKPIQEFMVNTLAGEGFVFDEIHIDATFEHERKDTRKPGTGMLKHLINNPAFDLTASYVIGDRWSDIQLAKNLGAKAIFFHGDNSFHTLDNLQREIYTEVIVLETDDWERIFAFLKNGVRTVEHKRTTSETDIRVFLNLDGTGKSEINTGIGFFDHILSQIARHGNIDLILNCKGDLHIDEHHSIEDIAIVLGEAFAKALSDKRGIERYGFSLPMDDCTAEVLVDFGGRSWLIWDATFMREKVGEMPTEMFFHFFKSFSDAAKCNLSIKATGLNEHHKIEAIFKAFAKAIKMAVNKNPWSDHLPSTKGVL